MADATLSEVVQQLRETNKGLVNVSESTTNERRLNEIAQMISNDPSRDAAAEKMAQISAEIKKQTQMSTKRLAKVSEKSINNTQKITQKVSSDVKQKTSETIQGVKDTTKKTIKKAPSMAISAIDPAAGQIFDTVSGAVSKSFGYFRSLGQGLGSDESGTEGENRTPEKLEENKEVNESGFQGLENVINTNFNQLLAFLRGESLDDLEQKREEARNNEAMLEAIQGIKLPETGAEEEQGGLLPMLTGGLGRIGPLIIKVLKPVAVAIGVIGGLLLATRDQLKLIVKVFRGIGSAVSKVGGLFAKVFSPRAVTGTFSGIVSIFRTTVDGVRSTFATLSNSVKAALQPVRSAVTFVKGLLGPLDGLSKGFSSVTRFLSPLTNLVTRTAGIVAKLFVPLRPILIAFETIKGALDGFKEGGILGGLQGAVTGFFNGLIGIPADLITNALAWVLDKFGFSNAAAALKEFSWTDLISDIVALPYDLVRGAFDWIKNLFGGFSFGDMISGALDIGKNFLQSMLRMILPDPGGDYGFADPRKYIAKAIPDSIYEFAGMNPETGELMEPEGGPVESGSAPASVSAGSQLEREGTQQRDAQREQAAARTATNGGGGNTNISTNVQNNQQSIIRNRPPASSEPDNASDTMMLGWAP
jgi:hypothetical protein